MKANAFLLLAGAAAMAMALDASTADALANPAATNGTVSFTVPNKNGTAVQATTCLTVEKAGKTALVIGKPGANQVSGCHNFPGGSYAGGMVAYYDGLLHNAGWTKGTDYTLNGNMINFYGVTKLDGGSSNSQIVMKGTTDSVKVSYTNLPHVKVMRVVRGGAGQDGMVTLVGFGISWNTTDQQITTSTSTVTVHFLATDSASDIMQEILNATTAAGWTATMDADGWLEISKNSRGDPVYSLWHSVEYQGAGSNDDDWIFEALQ